MKLSLKKLSLGLLFINLLVFNTSYGQTVAQASEGVGARESAPAAAGESPNMTKYIESMNSEGTDVIVDLKTGKEMEYQDKVEVDKDSSGPKTTYYNTETAAGWVGVTNEGDCDDVCFKNTSPTGLNTRTNPPQKPVAPGSETPQKAAK